MSNCFGRIFRVMTWGESHGAGVGVVVDGCPPMVSLTEQDIQVELDRRRPGQSCVVTARDEADRVEILSGVLDGVTQGTPISLLVKNKDQMSSAYDEMKDKYRPSHADYTYDAKYGIRAWAGGGRASARETIGRVAAGAVARAVLGKFIPGIDVVAHVSRVYNVCADVPLDALDREVVESNIVRTGDPSVADEMIAVITDAARAGDSVGGMVTCVVRNCFAGLGDPVFDKLDATLAHALMSIPATRSFEIGSGLDALSMKGSEHNDPFYMDKGRVRTRTNNSGGIQGGISNGEPIVLRVGFKPTATLMIDQDTVTKDGHNTVLKGKGRHDACVLPRAVPVVEAMVWLVLCDHYLRNRAQNG